MFGCFVEQHRSLEKGLRMKFVLIFLSLFVLYACQPASGSKGGLSRKGLTGSVDNSGDGTSLLPTSGASGNASNAAAGAASVEAEKTDESSGDSSLESNTSSDADSGSADSTLGSTTTNNDDDDEDEGEEVDDEDESGWRDRLPRS